MDNLMLKQTYFNFLKQEGFDPNFEKNEVISFFTENYRFEIIVEADTDDFHFIRMLCIVDASNISNFELLKFYKLCDYLNLRQKGSKFMFDNNNFILVFDLLMDNSLDIKKYFYRIMESLYVSLDNLFEILDRNIFTNKTINSFYRKKPLYEFDIDFERDFGILHYNGYSPNKGEFLEAINTDYFPFKLLPTNIVLPETYYQVKNNTRLDERVKAIMLEKKLTMCETNYQDGNIHRYYVNYSFNNYKSFGTIIIDSI